MVTQVSSKTTAAGTASAAIGQRPIGAPDTIQRPAVANVTPTARHRTPAFPEAAILSRQPLRYNVQLNQQLTAFQQADSYLSQTESKLMHLRHASSKGGDTRQITSDLQKHLNGRSQLSGGTVDRQFSLRLQQSSKVNFSLPGLETLVDNPQGETLIFSLGGDKRELAAVTLPQQEHPTQVLRQMNLGLGRLGIHAQLGNDGQTSFSVDEQRWGRVSEYLSVRGEGQSFPADAFTLLTPKAEASQEDVLQQATSGQKRLAPQTMNNVMDNIVKQRGRLHQHQGRAANRIDDLAPPISAQQAQATSQAVGNLLAKSTESYASFSKALSAQGNVRLATVKNLLG
ncbi:MAG TPA: hypothetical protein VGI71_07600 [Scandinavium sp.]|jgi:hypothetical protein